MANNYQQLSSGFKLKTIAEREWWERKLAVPAFEDNDEDDPDSDFNVRNYATIESDDNFLWFHFDESGDIDALVEVLQEFLKDIDPEGAIGFSWADTCSKPRVDEFGGGAVYITATDTKWMNTDMWLEQQGKRRD